MTYVLCSAPHPSPLLEDIETTGAISASERKVATVTAGGTHIRPYLVDGTERWIPSPEGEVKGDRGTLNIPADDFRARASIVSLII